MVTYDMYIGFEKKPEGLETFLEEQGYKKEDFQEGNFGVENYIHKENGSPSLIYYPQDLTPENQALRAENEEVPDWTKSGHKILSELEVEAAYDVYGAVDEAGRLSEEIVNHFDGIFYDIGLDEFFGKGEL